MAALVGDNLLRMTAGGAASGAQGIRVVFDMTFPDRNQGGSGVYARSVVSALRGRGDVEVGEIRSERPGLPRTVRWLAGGADRRLRNLRAHLLHCPNFVVPWKLPVPFVVTIFDLSTRRFPADHPLEWRVYERWLLPSRARAAARVIAISEVTRKDVIRHYGVDPDRAVTIHPGIDSRFFQPARAAPARNGEQRMLFPGAPVRRKNLELVLEAMALAKPPSALAKACLQISGAVAERFPEHVARIKATGLEGRVQWLGSVPADQMPALYAAADVCVYPSLYEGFGFPPLEAMASGTAVVASNASCLPEILGDAALLVDPGDVQQLSRAVESVLTDQAVRARLVDAGRKRAQGFTWDLAAERTAAVYREVLGRAT